MKKLTKTLITVMLASTALSLTACGGSDKEETSTTAAETKRAISSDELWGTWKGTDGEPSTLTLGMGGSYNDNADFAHIIGTYVFDEVINTLTVYESEYGMTFTYSVDLNDGVLTIQTGGGKPRKFVKQS